MSLINTEEIRQYRESYLDFDDPNYTNNITYGNEKKTKNQKTGNRVNLQGISPFQHDGTRKMSRVDDYGLLWSTIQQAQNNNNNNNKHIITAYSFDWYKQEMTMGRDGRRM